MANAAPLGTLPTLTKGQKLKLHIWGRSKPYRAEVVSTEHGIDVRGIRGAGGAIVMNNGDVCLFRGAWTSAPRMDPVTKIEID